MKLMHVSTHKALLLSEIEILGTGFFWTWKKTKSYGVASLEKGCYLRWRWLYTSKLLRLLTLSSLVCSDFTWLSCFTKMKLKRRACSIVNLLSYEEFGGQNLPPSPPLSPPPPLPSLLTPPTLLVRTHTIPINFWGPKNWRLFVTHRYIPLHSM